MKTLPIITIPNPKLRDKSLEVKSVTPKLKQFIENLEHTLIKKDDPPGVGLSAIQIAEPLRIFTIYLPVGNKDEEPPRDDKNFSIQTFINPTIVDASKELTLGPKPKRPIMEGCLSIPSIYGPVLRHKTIKLTYHTIEGSELVENTTTMTGFTARVVQHEQDHLDGILFTDKSLAQNQPLYEEQNGEFYRINLG